MSSFHQILDHIRAISESEAQKGRLFERLMKTYFEQDPLYNDRFARVSLWSEWAAAQYGFDSTDIGVDLVAEERSGGYCAVQCKCYAPGTRISKGHLDSFISASARDPFTSRMVVDTGDEWGPNAWRTLDRVKPECSVLRFGDLLSRPFDWPDLSRHEPETLAYRRDPYHLRPHQQAAFDDVIREFATHDRGKLIMACGTGKTFTAALAAFRAHYTDDSITKDAIFDYVYGVLHAPEYRDRFASDLAKDLPRLPMAPDFRAFADAGRALGELHLSYETCEEYPLRLEFPLGHEATPEQYRLGTRKMRLTDDGEALVVNDHVRLAGIPDEAHKYQVNGRTPLGWFIDRYHVKTDSSSGILNDPNGWFDDPRDLVSAVRRVVHVSVQTVAIIEAMPDPLAELEG